MRKLRVPDVAIRRLVIYLRILHDMDLSDPDVYISSQELGRRAGVSPAQVRKDLATFGEFGKQGVGYDDLDRKVRVAIIGVGELGTALSRYVSRRSGTNPQYPFEVTALFDSDPAKIGLIVEGVTIMPPENVAEITREKGLDIAVITVPAAAAQKATDRCVEAGVRAILNFAPVKLFVPDGIRVHYSDVSLELQQLAFYLS